MVFISIRCNNITNSLVEILDGFCLSEIVGVIWWILGEIIFGISFGEIVSETLLINFSLFTPSSTYFTKAWCVSNVGPCYGSTIVDFELAIKSSKKVSSKSAKSRFSFSPHFFVGLTWLNILFYCAHVW